MKQKKWMQSVKRPRVIQNCNNFVFLNTVCSSSSCVTSKSCSIACMRSTKCCQTDDRDDRNLIRTIWDILIGLTMFISVTKKLICFVYEQALICNLFVAWHQTTCSCCSSDRKERSYAARSAEGKQQISWSDRYTAPVHATRTLSRKRGGKQKTFHFLL